MKAKAGTAVTVEVPPYAIPALEQRMLEPPARKVWSDQEIAQLRRYYGKGKITIKDIADAMGCTTGQIRHKASELGLMGKRS